MSGENLKRSNSEKYLGVTLNNKLEWGEHIDNVCGTTSRLLGFLRCAMHRCPPHLKERAYKSLIRPRLEYCCCVWDPHHRKYHDKLEMVQRRAARFVTNNPRKRSSLQPSVSAMVDNLGWEPLTERRRRSRIIIQDSPWYCGYPQMLPPPCSTERRRSRSLGAVPSSATCPGCIQVCIHS